jgi:hypothetical protein
VAVLAERIDHIVRAEPVLIFDRHRLPADRAGRIVRIHERRPVWGDAHDEAAGFPGHGALFGRGQANHLAHLLNRLDPVGHLPPVRLPLVQGHILPQRNAPIGLCAHRTPSSLSMLQEAARLTASASTLKRS